MPTQLTITITRCGECPLFSPRDGSPGPPAMCLHDASGWSTCDDGDISVLVYPIEQGIPDNCPIIDTAVLYQVKVVE